MRFEKGECVSGLEKEPQNGRGTGTKIRWKPDLEVFTDINVPLEYYRDVLKRQAVVNEGITFILRDQQGRGFETYEFYHEHGITDYVEELTGEHAITSIQTWETEREGKDREDKPMYRVKMKSALCFSNKVQLKEYYHNSSWLEYGGAPDKAVRSAFVSQIDAYLKNNNKYQKNETRISFQDIEECLVLVVSSFSTASLTSYENHRLFPSSVRGVFH